MAARKKNEPAPPPIFPSEQDSAFPANPAEAEQVANAIADEASDPNRVDLGEYEPPPIGGDGFGGSTGRMSLNNLLGLTPNRDDEAARPMRGRPTSPPIYVNASLHPEITQLRVWKIVNGNPHSIGEIDANASEAEFIRYFLPSMPKPGEAPAVFKIRPVDQMGVERREETVLPAIDPDHATLRQLRAQVASGNAPGGYAPAAPVGLDSIIPLLDRLLGPSQLQASNAAKEAAAAREAAAAMQSSTASERVQLASHALAAQEALTERVLKTEQDRNASTQIVLQTSFQNMMQIQQAAADRERQAALDRAREDRDRREAERREDEERRRRFESEAEERRKADRLDAESRIIRDREEASTRLRILESEANARLAREREEAARQRDREDARRQDERERDRQDALVREAERQRQHEARLAEIKAEGEREREYRERMFQLQAQKTNETSAEGFMEKATKMLSLVGMTPQDVIGKVMGGDSAGMIETVVENGRQLVTGLANTYADVQKAKMAAESKAAAAQAAALAQPAALAGGVPQLVDTAQAAGAPAPAVAAVVDPVAALPLALVKEARTTLFNAVQKMAMQPQDTWPAVLLEAFALMPLLTNYLRAKAIRPALVEAGAPAEMIEILCAAMRHPMVPQHLLEGVREN